MKKKSFYFVKLFLLFVVYFYFAKLGLKLGAVNKFATFVWPPTGIALAFLLKFGIDLWPGVFFGAFLINFLLGAPLFSTFGIATGNTLEPLIGSCVLLYFFKFDLKIRNRKNALEFIMVAAVLGPLIAATFGVASLYFGHLVLLSEAPRVWFAWCFGDAIGALVFGSLLLAIFEKENFIRIWEPRVWFEWAILIFIATALSMIIFTDWLPQIPLLRWPYFLFPPLFWAATRFRLLGAAIVTFVILTIAVWGTANHLGFFATDNLSISLFHLQTLVAVLSITGIILASIINDWSRAERELQHAVNARDEFLSVASHELKTPVTSLKMQLQMIRLKVNPNENIIPSPSKLMQFLKISSKQMERLEKLVEELLDVTRIQSGHLEYYFEDVKLSEIVNEVVEQFEIQMSSSKCHLQTDIDPRIIGFWDRSRIEQVLVNLISNAVKYAAGAKIVIKAYLKDEGHTAVMSVQDNGPGIPQERHRFLFERFGRVTDMKHIPGLGLGLFIVKSIIRAHQGEVYVESSEGKGTNFIVELPVRDNI